MNKITKKEIINYADYKNGYVDTIYKFIIDNGIFYVACSDEVEGLDFIIDHLEDEGLDGWFIEVGIDNGNYIIDTENNEFYYDEFIIGGNHSKYLYHGGNFRIEEVVI